MTGTNDKIRSLFLAALMVFSVFAGTIALSGTAAAVNQTSNVSSDDNLDSNQVFWQGQGLLIDAEEANNASETWQIWTVTSDDQLGSLEAEFNLDSNGTAVINTANLDGEYVVTTADRQVVTVDNGDVTSIDMDGTTTDTEVAAASWSVTTQDLDVSFDSNSAGNTGSAASADVTFTSNRGNYDVFVTGTRDGNALSEDSLAAITGGTTTGEGGVLISAQSSSTKTFDFTGMPAGNYSFSFAVVDTTASASDSITVEDISEGRASLATNTIEVPQGDVAAITVELSEAATGGTAYLQIGEDDESGYQANVTVTDGNADGEVTVLFNTYGAASTSNGWVVKVADTGDSVSFDATNNQTVFSGNDILDNGDYGLSVGVAKPWAGQTADDLGSLFLTERETTGVTLWTAPKNTGATDVGELTAAATQDSTTAAQDLAIVQVEASGLGGLIAAEGNLSNAFASGSLNLTVTQTEESTLQNRDPKRIDVSNSDITYFADTTNDSYYIVINTAEVDFKSSAGTSLTALSAGEAYTAVMTVKDDRLLGSTLDDAHQSVNGTFEVEQRSVTLSSAAISVQPAADQTISGTSTVAPGSSIKVVVQSTGDTQPRFIMSETATVGADGTWSVSFDFSGQSLGDTFSVTASTVAADGTVEDVADGEVQEAPTPTDTPTETPTESPTPTETPTESPTEPPTTEPPTEPPTTTTTTTPGFGIAVALVALLAAALLAVRRD